jgi:hypothetical protein
MAPFSLDTLSQPTPGEYVHAFIRAELRGDREAFDDVLTRVVATDSTIETAGLVPTEITGDLIKFVDANRYVVGSMREMPMPTAGKTFTRPRATQRTLAGKQVAEFGELTSQQLTIVGDAIPKSTHGSVLEVSEQDIDWTDAAMLQIVLEDMADSYALSTEAEAAAAVEAGIVHGTNDGTLSLTADAATFHQAIAAAAGAVYGTAKRLPDTLYVAVDRWAYLVGLVDLQGRPLYPNLGPVNAPGTMNVASFDGAPMGLKLVVSPAFRQGFVALGVSRLLEQFEMNKGLVMVPQPATLSVQIAYRGYFATNVQTKALVALEELGADGFWGADLV